MKKAFVLILFSIYLVLTTYTEAYTDIKLIAKDGVLVPGRTLEYGYDDFLTILF